MPDVVCPEDVREVNDAQLHASLMARCRSIDVQLAIEAVELAEWHNRRIWSDDDSHAAYGRLARETRMSPKSARHKLHRALRLQSMPLTLRAFIDGDVSASCVDLLVRANQPNTEELFRRDEEMLLTIVREMRFDLAAKSIEYWIQQADEAGTKDKAKRQLEQRTAHLSKTLDGTLDIRALCDPISGEIISTEHSRLVDILFKQDWAEAKEIYGDKVTMDVLKRTPAQRRHDAFVEMAKRSAAMASDSVMPRPLFSVVIGRTGFENMMETARGTVIAPDLILPHLGEADIERIVFDGPSRVIDLGAQRSFRAGLRRILEIRDPTCQHPSECDVPADRCEGDHIVAYTKGGPTEQNNGQMLCSPHNRSKGSGPPEGKAA